MTHFLNAMHIKTIGENAFYIKHMNLFFMTHDCKIHTISYYMNLEFFKFKISSMFSIIQLSRVRLLVHGLVTGQLINFKCFFGKETDLFKVFLFYKLIWYKLI